MSPRITGAALGLLAFIAAPMVASSARAQINSPSSVQSHQELIQKLKEAREIADENGNNSSQDPITAREFYQQESELTSLIQRLKRGEKVSPQDITEALKSPSASTF